jgi:hypothetical protein
MTQPDAATCWRCGTAIDARQRVGRRDACPRCAADLHCCRNCGFHDPSMHNQCREPQAERQVDKERGNFCEWFSLGAARAAGDDKAAAARARLEAMFGTKRFGGT